jgi:hypothetical protein
MVSFKELVVRTKQHFRFSKQELQGIAAGILITGFIFSFRYWGMEEFDLSHGLKNLFLTIIAAGIGFFGHIAPQKLYALSCGYRIEFKTWWAGILIALVLAFISLGNFTLVLAGGAAISFVVRQRLGEFRYGYSMEEQAIVGLWGVLGSLIIAALFRVFSLFLPEVLFFERGMMISLIFAICSVLPLPKLEGLSIFFGSRGIYFISVAVVLIVTLLLLLGGGWGLLLGIILGLIAGGIAILYGSEL